MWDALQNHLLRAREEALRLKNPFIGTEHLLLALLEEEPALMRQVGIDASEVRRWVVDLAEAGQEQIDETAQLPFTQRARRVLEIAGAQSMQCFDDQVRPEYLLVALAQIREALAGQVLHKCGHDDASLRREFRLEPLDEELARRVKSTQSLWVKEPFKSFVGRAYEAAREHAHPFIGTEHLLLAMLSEPEGKAVSILHSLGAELEAVRAAVEARLEPADGPVGEGQLPFSASAKAALEQAHAEAVRRGDPAISSGHLLVGLVSEPSGIAGAVLRESFGLDADAVRKVL